MQRLERPLLLTGVSVEGAGMKLNHSGPLRGIMHGSWVRRDESAARREGRGPEDVVAMRRLFC